jgi:hypothetical protein
MGLLRTAIFPNNFIVMYIVKVKKSPLTPLLKRGEQKHSPNPSFFKGMNHTVHAKEGE